MKWNQSSLRLQHMHVGLVTMECLGWTSPDDTPELEKTLQIHYVHIIMPCAAGCQDVYSYVPINLVFKKEMILKIIFELSNES